MKAVKRTGAFFLALVMVFSLSACVTLKPKEEGTGSGQAAEGTYTLFAITIEGYLTEKATVNMESEVTLKGGGGSITINGENSDITSWSADGEAISVTIGETTTEGSLSGGVLALDLGNDMTAFYAAEGADLSGYRVLTTEEFYALMGADPVSLTKGQGYYYGTGEEGFDLQKAAEWFQKAAEEGNADAWYYLGKLAEYSLAEGHEQTMLADFAKAAELGSPLGLYAQGRAYMIGKGVAADYATAQSFFQQAIAFDCKEANKGLGDLYMFGYGVEADAQQALTYYTAATGGREFGIVHAAELSIGDLYYYGRINGTPDYAKALEWYQKAADAGYAEALVSIAFAYEEGNGVPQDFAAAKELFEKAAALGEPDAMRELGNLNYNGSLGQKDLAAALSWYEQAAMYADAASCFNAADMYQYGDGTEVSTQKAVEWYMKAAQEGNSSAYSRIADIYHFSEYGIVDEEQALKYYKLADKAGDAYGTARAGSFYYWGYGVEIKYKKAVKYFKKAVKYDDPTGQYYLGTAYYQGHGVKQNNKKAAKYFKLAAKNNDPYGQMWTGYMYYKGLGVKKNRKTAKKWLNKALKAGTLDAESTKQAKKWLKAINK